MPVWLEILLVVIVGVVVVLAAGGVLANARRRQQVEGDFAAQVEAADAQLAAAAAADRGWDRALLEDAARDAWQERHGAEELLELALVEVTDRPGTEEDVAVFRITGRDRVERLVLTRRGNTWVPGEG